MQVRSSKQDQIHNSIVSTLLALMDGLDSRGSVVVIGALPLFFLIRRTQSKPQPQKGIDADSGRETKRSLSIARNRTEVWMTLPDAGAPSFSSHLNFSICSASQGRHIPSVATHAVWQLIPQINPYGDFQPCLYCLLECTLNAVPLYLGCSFFPHSIPCH